MQPTTPAASKYFSSRPPSEVKTEQAKDQTLRFRDLHRTVYLFFASKRGQHRPIIPFGGAPSEKLFAAISRPTRSIAPEARQCSSDVPARRASRYCAARKRARASAST